MSNSDNELTGADPDDIEGGADEDEQLDELDAPDPQLSAEAALQFWETRQRELVTSTINYTLPSILLLVDRGKIDLTPDFQRRNRWDPVRQSQLIESYLINVPVPPVFLNEDERGQYSVIDGKQRLTAIDLFFRDELELSGLEVFPEVNGLRMSGLPPELRDVLETRSSIQAVIILKQSDPQVKFDVFQRLNRQGIVLNPQELRHSTWPGSLNSRLLELATSETFRHLLGPDGHPESRFVQEMRDTELVLRFLALRNTWREYDGQMRHLLDSFMEEHQHAEPAELDQLESDFLAARDLVHALFDDKAYRRWMPANGRWRKPVLVAAYDAQMLAAYELRTKSVEIIANRDVAVQAYRRLYEDDEFRGAVDAATNTATYLRTRVELAIAALMV